MAEVAAYLLDIEGTTTPVDFVYKTLFPFARERLPAFLERNFDSEAVSDAVSLLAAEYVGDSSDTSDLPQWQLSPQSVADYALWLMDRDRKSTGLKALQGMIWKAGYEDGSLKGIVYPDVVAAFSRWRVNGKKIAIYSSGSVLAQKLLFAHTQAGDLTPLIDDYFDTTTGPKREASSYRQIASGLGLTPERICFLSDVVEELYAAQTAEFQTLLVLRDEAERPDDFCEKRCVQSFDGLD